MYSYIPESPLHYALNYLPYTYSVDPVWGLIAFLKTTSEHIHKLRTDYPSFNVNAKRLLIESEESEKTFGVIEIGLEEFVFGMMDKEVFEVLATKLNLTIYRKEGDVGTNLFTANDFFCAVESMIRQLLVDQILAEL